MKALQRALTVIYPHQCLLCDEIVDQPGAVCPTCWTELPFETGHACETCAAPLVGESDGFADLCDACLAAPRPWLRARAALHYSGAARRVVLGLKHADRTEFVKPAARWMVRAGRDVLSGETILVPVPIHWSRRLRRRYNQSAELARAIGSMTGSQVLPDALVRTRATAVQEDMTAEERHVNQSGSMRIADAVRDCLRDRDVVMIDDVMTSGATLGVAAETLAQAGAARISCLVLARAARRP